MFLTGRDRRFAVLRATRAGVLIPAIDSSGGRLCRLADAVADLDRGGGKRSIERNIGRLDDAARRRSFEHRGVVAQLVV